MPEARLFFALSVPDEVRTMAVRLQDAARRSFGPAEPGSCGWGSRPNHPWAPWPNGSGRP